MHINLVAPRSGCDGERVCSSSVTRTGINVCAPSLLLIFSREWVSNGLDRLAPSRGHVVDQSRPLRPRIMLASASRKSLLFERSFDFCLNNATESHHENIQCHRLLDYFLLPAGLYVFRPNSFGAMDWNVDW